MKKKFEIDKFSKSIIIMFAVYLIIALAIFLPGYYTRQHNKIFIVTNNYKIKYEYGKWNKITDTKDYVLKNFSVLENGNDIGKYKILFSNRIKLLNEDNITINTNGVLFAYRGTIGFKNYNYSIDNTNLKLDDSIFEEVKKELGIKYVIDYAVVSVIRLNDENKIIYSLTNNNAALNNPNSLDGMANNDDDKFSVLLTIENGKIKIIDKKVESDPNIFEVYNIFDLYGDGVLEVVYGDRNVQVFSECIKLYNLSKNKQIKDFCK